MAEIRYTKQAKKVFVGGQQVTKYYPVIVRNGNIKSKSLSTKVAKASTISEVEAQAFVKAVVYAVVEALKDGQAVKLDGLGTFSPAIKSKSVRTYEEFKKAGQNLIEKKMISFRPDAELKKALKSAQFRLATNIDVNHIPSR